MNPRKQVVVFIIAMLLTACGGCGKPSVAPLPETPFTKAARAADDIAGAAKLLVSAESNLERQNLISTQDGLTVINALAVVLSANAQFIKDIELAAASGSKSAAVASGKALVKAIGGLTGLTIKNPQAKQTFDTIMGTINIALPIIEQFTQ